MNKDIRLHIEFWSHAKTRRMIRELGLQGPVSLQILWCYAAKHRTDGVLSKMDSHDIEEAAGWPTDRTGEFFRYCTRNRWLDREGRGVWKIHEWYEYNPWAAEAAGRAEDGKRGAHERHHVQKGVCKPDKCKYCAEALGGLKPDHDTRNAPSAPAPTPAPAPSPAPVAEREREATSAHAQIPVAVFTARAREVSRFLNDHAGAVQCFGCPPHKEHAAGACPETLFDTTRCDCEEVSVTRLSAVVARKFIERFGFDWETWCGIRDRMREVTAA